MITLLSFKKSYFFVKILFIPFFVFFSTISFGGIYSAYTSADFGAGSLRQAILDANASGQSSTIYLTPATVNLTHIAVKVIKN